MNTDNTLWSASITCEKTLETKTTTMGTKIVTAKVWKTIEAFFDFHVAEPVTYPHVCPHCGQPFSVTVTPRKDYPPQTAQEVEKKFSARLKKRLLQLLLALIISVLFLPPLLLQDSTLAIILIFVSMVGWVMLFYFTVMIFRILRTRGKYRRDGSLPIRFYMETPYTVALSDPTNVHVWKRYRMNNMKTVSSLQFADLPPAGNLDEAPEFNEGPARL